MRHSSTQQLHAYWLRKRGGSPAPLRSAIEPAAIVPLLGDLFILDAAAPGTAPFRLAGTRFCANLGRELTGSDFLSLWPSADRDALTSALGAIVSNGATAVLEVLGRTGRGNPLTAEMLLLPVSQDGRRIDRVLGLLAPLERPYWLGLHPIPQLEIASGPGPAAPGGLPGATRPACGERAAACGRPPSSASRRPRRRQGLSRHV
ncbi:MAG: PAS domain-containing protein [Rhizobiales bacterium]|nr:PAS domain-containing protein [Hyphomicrobiales bacterium]